MSSLENSRGSSDYQGVAESLDRPDDKAVWGNSRLCVSGRLPHFCMSPLRFPTPPKMQKFAITRFLTTMSGNARHRREPLSPLQNLQYLTFQILLKCTTRPISPTGLERPPQARAKRDEGRVGFRELRRRKVGFAGRGQVYLNHGLQNRSLYCEAISENQSTPNTHAWPSRHRLTSPRSTKKSNRKFGCFWRCVGDSNP